MNAYGKATIALGAVAVASMAGYFYLNSLVYHPVVHVDLPDGLSITAVLPDTRERAACELASNGFTAPFKQSCKDCKVSLARCDRNLQDLELAMREGRPVPHPMVVANDLRIAVMGPSEAAKAGCQVIAANMVAHGAKSATCVLSPPATPKS